MNANWSKWEKLDPLWCCYLCFQFELVWTLSKSLFLSWTHTQLGNMFLLQIETPPDVFLIMLMI